jgi:hypothetical protein
MIKPLLKYKDVIRIYVTREKIQNLVLFSMVTRF